MDYTQPHFWIALSSGGALIAALSAGQQAYAMKVTESQESFRIRPVIRDFCIGAFLTCIAYMFLPESMTQWVESAQKGITSSFSSFSSSQSGGSSSDLLNTKFEIKTGPARF